MAFRLADNWLFGNRRWLNPRVPEELSILARKYGEICEAFPMFERCSRDRYIHIIMSICSSWCGGVVKRVGSHKSNHINAAVDISASSLVNRGSYLTYAGGYQHAHPCFQQALLQRSRPRQRFQSSVDARAQSVSSDDGETTGSSSSLCSAVNLKVAVFPTSAIIQHSLLLPSPSADGLVLGAAVSQQESWIEPHHFQDSPSRRPASPRSAGEVLDQLLTAHWAGKPLLQAMKAEALEEFCTGDSL